MNSITKFFRTSAIFFIGSVLSKAIVFLMLPIYTKYLPTAEYGYFDLSVTYVTVLTSLLFFDIWWSVMRYMYDSDRSDYKYRSVLSGFTIFAASSVLYGLVALVLAQTTSIRYLQFILLYGITNNIAIMYSFIGRGFGKNVDFAVSGIINALAEAILNIVLIVGLRYNFASLYIAGICGNILQIFYLEYKVGLFTHIKIKQFDKKLTFDMLKYTLPLSLNSVAYWLLTSYNRIAINQVMGTGENGIYAVGSKFGGVIALVTTCFNYAWQDISYSRESGDKGNGSYYSRVCRMYLWFLGAGVVLLMPACRIVFPFMVGSSYKSASGTIPLFLLTAVTGAYTNFLGNIFYAIKRTKAIFISTVAACVINLCSCYPLIHLWGLNGANAAILVSFAADILIRALLLKKLMGFRLDYKAIILLSVWIVVTVTVYINGAEILNAAWFILCAALVGYKSRSRIAELLTGLRKR